MRISSKYKYGLAQLLVLILVSLIAWQRLHEPPYVSTDVYPYLSSLPLAVIKQCLQERHTYPSIIWEDLLAIRSTLSQNEADRLVGQLKVQVNFSNLNWNSLSKDARINVQRHREILNKYVLYKPNKYTFPVVGPTWYEDSFGADREGGKRKHQGTDLFGSEGTSIVSVCGGTIEQLGWNRLGGERVGVRGDDGNYYYYAHLQFISPLLIKGKRIEVGDSVGTMGHTGDALTTPDHLHFGIELPNGQWINPYPFLKAWQIWSSEGNISN